MWVLSDMTIMINMFIYVVTWMWNDMPNMSKLSSILKDMNTKWHVYYV
jgi:hypothetical protein